MAIAKSLPPTDPFFIQECPLCGTKQRMMIRGVYVENGKSQLFPDMGYSFCNCRNIFFTKWENVTRPGESINSAQNPIARLQKLFSECKENQIIKITMRDPYFCIWTRPHDFTGFNPRVNHTLWDMQSFANECIETGFELISMERDMDVNSETPECCHIILQKPKCSI